MKAIKQCLTERQYLWHDAVSAARNDPEIDMNAKDGEEAYKPSAFEEEYEPVSEQEAQEANKQEKNSTSTV